MDFQLRETFESALAFGGATLRKLGAEAAEIDEVIADVRRRDAERLELQIAGGLQAGRGLMRGNAPVPAPLAPPRRAGQALNPEAADILAAAPARDNP